MASNKIEIINFFQNNPFAVQHTNSMEFPIGPSVPEIHL